MSVPFLLLFACVGIFAGLLGGLLGVSGGLITVPSLLFLFAYLHFPDAHLMHLAIGTSLASMVMNALAATIAHHKRGGVLWHVVLVLFPGILVGSVFGAFVAGRLSSAVLQHIFGVFACMLSIYFLFSRKTHGKDSPDLPPGPFLCFIGFLIASLSNILGLGGSIMTVPILLACRVKMRQAVGTSAASGLFITTIGAVSFLSFRFGKEVLPYSAGYIYLPAFIMISIATFLAAPMGARLAHHLPSLALKKIFALALIGAGLTMLFR